MSMLSAQCDELRELALWLDDEFYDVEATKVRDAADTILSLRDRAQELQSENAKLRELCADMHAVISDRNSWWDCMRKDTRRFADRMRELGIEVDG